jgi:hypothetical protein
VIVRGRFPVPRGGRRSPRPALPIAWVVLALTAAACGEGAPPPPELPGFETPRGPTELTVALDVTFTQGEAPIQVPRTVVIPLGDDLQGNEAFLLEAALEALVAGPTPDEEARGITSFFSEATADLVAEVTLEGDSAMVDCPRCSDPTSQRLLLHGELPLPVGAERHGLRPSRDRAGRVPYGGLVRSVLELPAAELPGRTPPR